MVPCPRCPPAARGLLALLLLLLPVRGARGLCGAPPELSAAKPEPLNRARRELNPTASPETDPAPAFPVGATVRYRCQDGFVKIPGKSDTVTCLPSSRWSNIEDCCGRSCDVPPRLKSAVLVQKDADKSYYPVGTHVSYVCRPGYESAEATHNIACLENQKWSEAPEFCRGKSCGVPKGPENGRAADKTTHQFGARVEIICDDGFKLFGHPFIFCVRKDDHVEWSVLPTCQIINTQDKPTTVPPEVTDGGGNASVINTQDKPTTVPPEVTDGGGNASVIITQDKPTTIPPEVTDGGGNASVINTQHKPSKVPPEGADGGGNASVINTQDKPTKVPPEGADGGGNASESGMSMGTDARTGTDAPTGIGTDTSTGTLIGIGIGIGIPIGFGIGFACICFGICVRKKKKGSYNVDSLKTTLQQLSSQMSEKKTTGCSDSMSPERIGLNV